MADQAGLMQPVAFTSALRFWFKLGCISFGGPTGQIAIMHQELVERRRWISEPRFLHALNFCMLLPGPEAQQLATYIGWLLHGIRGGLAAGALFVLPSLFLLLALSWMYAAFGDVPEVAGVLYGVKPAVIAIVAFAAWRLGSRTLRDPALWVIAAAAFAAIAFFEISFPYIILGAGLIGYLGGRIAPARFRGGAQHGAGLQTQSASLIDDQTPAPEHVRVYGRRIALYVTVGVLLWGAVLGVLWLTFGWSGVFTQMGWFFTKAALLTFGGAYAVLPYVQQAAVEQFGWLSAAQMIDGLALGETTPGPLIMVVTFVGFVGAWTHNPFGGELAAWSGIVGGLVATWFTFLPSFLFIFAGAPLVERTRGDHELTAPLVAITAAVVGVIVNLAVYFAAHVLWPGGATLDWLAVAISVGAFIALWRFKVGVIPVIAACAMIGLASTVVS
jgi:chromate transporter